jgi:hypothetical protein
MQGRSQQLALSCWKHMHTYPWFIPFTASRSFYLLTLLMQSCNWDCLQFGLCGDAACWHDAGDPHPLAVPLLDTIPVCRLHYQVCLLLWIQLKDTHFLHDKCKLPCEKYIEYAHRVSAHLEIHQGSQDIGGGFWIAPCIELCLTLPLSSTGHYVYLVRLGKLRSRKMEFDAGTCWADLTWNKVS